jgi:predicted nucleic acid-binding protein
MESKPLDDAPEGISIFVDTNVLIYHLPEDEIYGVSCRNFLRRVEEKSVTGFTSPTVISETLFLYLRFWVIANKKIAPKKVLDYIKRHRGVTKEVDFPKPQTLFTIFKILSINNAVLRTSYDMTERYNLLPNDAINTALIRRYGLPAIATRDDDFDDIDGIVVFKPEASSPSLA